MGMVGEFFRYFRAVLLGKRDPLLSFLEPLTMGERYLRWGTEKGDLRDFRAGLDQLRLCPDAYAPLPSLLLRKYACVNDLACAALDRLIARHEKIAATAEKNKQERLYEKEVLEKNAQASRDKAAQLRSVGSLIKAKEEDKITLEIDNQLRDVKASIEEADDLSDICDSYDQTVADATRFLQEMDQAIVLVTACQRLGPDLRTSLSKHIQTKLDAYKKRLDDLNPIQA